MDAGRTGTASRSRQLPYGSAGYCKHAGEGRNVMLFKVLGEDGEAIHGGPPAGWKVANGYLEAG